MLHHHLRLAHRVVDAGPQQIATLALHRRAHPRLTGGSLGPVSYTHLDVYKRQDLVTIPGPEQAKVEEAPPFNRWNFAYIEIPGPYEKNLPSVYYLSLIHI